MKIQIRNGQCTHVEIYNYPDGQKNVKLDMSYFNMVKYPVDIYASIRNFNDLELLLCIIAALRKHDFVVKFIKFNYLFGLRSDRSFEPGMPNYLRDVLIPILKNMQIDEICILSPHNKLALQGLQCNEFSKFPNFDGLVPIGADESVKLRQLPFDINFHKIRKEKNEIEISLSAIESNIIKSSPEYIPLLIVDDLCDGGATFISIANYLNDNFPERLRFLYVTHGLFTKGVDHVAQHYDKIITTNSYQDFEPHPKLEVLDVWS